MFRTKFSNKSLTYKYNLDFPLILATLVLLIVGVLFIHSAGSFSESGTSLKPYIKQLIFLIPGAGVFAFFLIFNYQKLSNYWLFLYISAIILLVLVIVPGISKEIKGARSWFSIGGMSFQPSEPAKLIFIFALAKFIDWVGKKMKEPLYFFIALFIPIPIVALIMVQSDPGTALVYLPITLAMILVGMANIKHIVVLIGIGIIALFFTLYPTYQIMKTDDLIKKDKIEALVYASELFKLTMTEADIKELKKGKLTQLSDPTIIRNEKKKKTDKIKKIILIYTLKVAGIAFGIVLILFLLYRLTKFFPLQVLSLFFLVVSLGLFTSIAGLKLIKPHHAQRMLVVLDLEKDPSGVGYHQTQAKIAMGSGGIFGHGLLQGPQNNLNFIPEKTTDFIFTVIAEEWGFIGVVFIFSLFSVLLYRGLMIAYNSKDYFGTLIATGITTLYFSHFAINIGMEIGVLPVMGLPLPFLSAGGTSLLTSLAGIALLLNISHRRFVH